MTLHEEGLGNIVFSREKCLLVDSEKTWYRLGTFYGVCPYRS